VKFPNYPVDKAATLQPQGGRGAGPGRSVRGGYCLRLIATTVLAAIITINNQIPSNANMNLKLYAYNLLSWKEFECFNWLIHKESRWNYKAVSPSGNHYGLGQMRSTWYRDLTPKRQIKETIKYTLNRYGSVCNALEHFDRKGWH